MSEPKKNLWLTLLVSGVAAFLVWQQVARSSRPSVTNAKQDGRVVVLFGESSPASLALDLEKELKTPVRDATRLGDTSQTALLRLGEALALKPNFLLLRLGQADLAKKNGARQDAEIP